jgi:hypothetical protein
MAKFKQLRDIYRFPRFSPRQKISGIFGDPRAVLIRLKRRGKKRSVEAAGRSIVLSTIEGSAGFEISPAGIRGFTWTWRFAGSFVAGARR